MKVMTKNLIKKNHDKNLNENTSHDKNFYENKSHDENSNENKSHDKNLIQNKSHNENLNGNKSHDKNLNRKAKHILLTARLRHKCLFLCYLYRFKTSSNADVRKVYLF